MDENSTETNNKAIKDKISPEPLKPFADPVMEAVFANEGVAGLAARGLINAILAESGDPLIGEITRITPQKSMPDVLGRGYRFDIELRT